MNKTQMNQTLPLNHTYQQTLSLNHTYQQQTCLQDLTYKMKEHVKVLIRLSTCVNTVGLVSHSQDAGWL